MLGARISRVVRGRLISIEGIDGAGKSTLAEALESKILRSDLKCIRTREPGGTALGEQLREMILRGEVSDSDVELLMFLAARLDHYRGLIAPALSRGTWVVCDRFIDSTMAYQGGGRQLPVKGIVHLHEHFDIPLPDCTFLLDLPVNAGLMRTGSIDPNKPLARPQHKISDRQESLPLSGAEHRGDRFESEKVDFFRRVRKKFLELAEESEGRIQVIDARDNAADVAELAWRQLIAHYPLLQKVEE